MNRHGNNKMCESVCEKRSNDGRRQEGGMQSTRARGKWN